MDASRSPSAEELPSSKQLLRSTGVAAAIAAALLVTTILPAEYGIDPTGIGQLLGLKRMGEVKAALAEEAAIAEARTAPESQKAMPAAEAPAAPPAVPGAVAAVAPAQPRKDEVRVVLKPGQAAEVKLVMSAGARATFRWTVTGGHVNFDTHGDPMDNPNGYHGYGKGQRSTGQEGVLEAAFHGRHGWFWRNRSDAEVTVILNIEGDYQDIKRML